MTTPHNPLTTKEFEATMSPSMKPVPSGSGPSFDFWPYFDALPSDEFQGHDFSDGQVDNAYRNADETYEHVLVRCKSPNVFFVLVLDLNHSSVFGHHLLDLREKYGVE